MVSSENLAIKLIFSALLIIIYCIVSHVIRITNVKYNDYQSFKISYLHESSVAILLGLLASIVLKSVITQNLNIKGV